MSTVKLDKSTADEVYEDINGQKIPFNPIFDKTYWPELIELQNQVTAVSNENITFNDVCLNPLEDESNPLVGGRYAPSPSFEITI